MSTDNCNHTAAVTLNAVITTPTVYTVNAILNVWPLGHGLSVDTKMWVVNQQVCFPSRIDSINNSKHVKCAVLHEKKCKLEKRSNKNVLFFFHYLTFTNVVTTQIYHGTAWGWSQTQGWKPLGNRHEQANIFKKVFLLPHPANWSATGPQLSLLYIVMGNLW